MLIKKKNVYFWKTFTKYRTVVKEIIIEYLKRKKFLMLTSHSMQSPVSCTCITESYIFSCLFTPYCMKTTLESFKLSLEKLFYQKSVCYIFGQVCNILLFLCDFKYPICLNLAHHSIESFRQVQNETEGFSFFSTLER